MKGSEKVTEVPLDFGIQIGDLFTQFTVIMNQLWPVIAIMASISIAFWIASRVRGFTRPR